MYIGSGYHSYCAPLLLSTDIISGRRPPSFLVYSTGVGSYPTAGSLSDRIKGITTVFFLAVLLGEKSGCLPVVGSG